MQVVRGYRSALRAPGNAPAWGAAAVAIGNFDGVHLGHRALISRARDFGLHTVALTFDPHPTSVVGKGGPPMLSSLDRRIELLGEAGVDTVVVEPFTMDLATLAPHAFVDVVLLHALHARAVVVGYDFTYGQQRAGTTETLQAHGTKAGFQVAIIDAVEIGGEVASSTRIRNYLREGNCEAAARLLGRSWDVDGTVVHGAKRGRAIGIPTANIAPTSDLVVAPGIYAVTLTVDERGDGGRVEAGEGEGAADIARASRVWGEGKPLPAVASLGRNPTFVEQGGLVLEVHVLDFDEDLYDRVVRTTFVSRIRDELKFDSVDALVAQIHSDIDVARQTLRC